MTSPIADIMPYGVTYIPNPAWGIYMEVHESAGSVKNTASSIKVPKGVFMIQISSSMVGDTTLQVTYVDDSAPRRSDVIFTDGGRYMETLSGENIDFIRVGNKELDVNRAAGKRCTVQIIPIPNPM